MEITDIRIRKVDSEGKLKAYVTLTFDGCFVVHNLKIISGQAGTFVAMPSRKTKKGEYKDIAHPINSDFRSIIQERILDEYHRLDQGQDEEVMDRSDDRSAHKEEAHPEETPPDEAHTEERHSEETATDEVHSEGVAEERLDETVMEEEGQE